MQSVDDSIEYVNQQIAFYRSRIDNPNTRNLKFFQHHLDSIQGIKTHLEQVKSRPIHEPIHIETNQAIDYLSISPSDIEGLPKELIDELGLTDSDHTEFEIVNLIKQCGGIMSLDHILIALFKKKGAIHKRKILTAKLYRMVQKGLIFTDKRGVYSTLPADNEKNKEVDAIEDLI